MVVFVCSERGVVPVTGVPKVRCRSLGSRVSNDYQRKRHVGDRVMAIGRADRSGHHETDGGDLVKM